MGNQVDKSHGGRGRPLGSAEPEPPPQKKSTKILKKIQQKVNIKKASPAKPRSIGHTTQQPHVQHSVEEQRAARSKLVSSKRINVQSELKKKEKMLHIMDAADAVSQGQQPPALPSSMYDNTSTGVSQSMSPKQQQQQQTSGSSTNLYMAEPSSKTALAAEKRLQQKTTKKGRSAEERKGRTMDLLFGDGLKTKDEDDEVGYDSGGGSAVKPSAASKSAANETALYKSDKDVPLNSDSRIVEAAMARFDKQKAGKVVNSKDRKQRTMQLMHGDLLKDEDEMKAQPRGTAAYMDHLDPEVVAVHQSILNLNNCNPHEKMPPTAKLLRKVATNLLGADSADDQEKFGKLRLANKKINSAFVDMEYGVETLEALGFTKKKIYNEKEHQLEEYMVFDFQHTNHKALLHVMDLLNEYYPEM